MDAGNSLLGDRPFSTESKAATSIEAMNRMGYDAMAIGLGDLKLDLPELRKRMQEARFPFLSANVRLERGGELLTQEYVVKDIAGHRVAIIGLTEAGQASGYRVDDPLATAKRLAPAVAREADIVILLTHAPASVARQIAHDVPQLDLVVCGGDESVVPGEMIEGRTLLVHADIASPGHAGRNMGLLEADFDSRGLLTNQTNTIVVLSESMPEDAEVAAWVAEVTS